VSQQLYIHADLLRTLSIGVLMRDLLRCRRGSAAFATIIALVPLIGVVALGAEAGSWYVTRQHAQNAADTAAYSGALRLACTISGGSCDNTQTVDYRGKQFAAQNTFCTKNDSTAPDDTTAYPGRQCAASLPARTSQLVTIEIGDYNAGTFTTPPASSGNAVRATVSQTQPGYLAAVLNLTTVTIPARAIALVQKPDELCALSLGPDPNGGGGALKLAGNMSNNGTGCAIMSDTSVQFASTPAFTGSGWAVLGATGCSPTNTCADPRVAHNYFMPPALDPLQRLNTQTFNNSFTSPPFTDTTVTGNNDPSVVACPASAPAGATKCFQIIPNSASSGYKNQILQGTDYYFCPPAVQATYFFKGNVNVNAGTLACNPTNLATYYFWSGINVSSGSTVTFAPGIYYFNGAASFGGTVSFGAGTYFFNGNTTLSGTITLSAGTYFFNGDTTFNGTITGTNVTLVLLGTSRLTINGGNVDLSAPTVNAYSTVLNGILIDDQSAGSVSIGGNGVTKLGGAMYFPKADVSFGGSTQPTNTTCSQVIAKTLNMSGSAYLSTAGCDPLVVAHSQVVALVQ
jgi:Flp pilus assembly protein TadG